MGSQYREDATTMKKQAVIPIGPLHTMTIELGENDYIPGNSHVKEVET